ncbi:MAG: helix-turn-helix domain-containing protein [Candidatus Aminicenantales bacterium]
MIMSRFLETLFAGNNVQDVSVSNLPTLDDLVSEYILTLLALTRHNVSQTARILNISRTTLYNRIRRTS